jgi:predicted CoA-binding protein
MPEKVAILGASDNPERYAHKAYKMLQEYGHQVYPVNPHIDKIEEDNVFPSLTALPDQVDTVTLYVNPQRLPPYLEQIKKLNPKRVIFNPGTESKEIEEELAKAGIKTEEACTLVLLRTNQF